MNIASYLSWYKHNTQGVQRNDVHKVQVSERYSFSNLKLKIRTKRTTITYTKHLNLLQHSHQSSHVVSCPDMSDDRRTYIYHYIYGFEYLKVHVKSYGTSKIAERVDSTYLYVALG